MTEKKYFIGETIGCTPSKRESEIVRSRKVNGITLTGDEYTQIRGIILETMERLEKDHLLPGVVMSLEVAQYILEKDD